jgi:hypothetical protein
VQGAALSPLTAAGASSGLVNVAHQPGGSLGFGILVTVFAGATSVHARHSSGQAVDRCGRLCCLSSMSIVTNASSVCRP